MKVMINGQTEIIDVTTLADLCKGLTDHPNFIATAVNGDFVTVDERADKRLCEGDVIEILSPRQGG